MEFIEQIQKDKYRIVKLNRPKVNALNASFVAEIRSCFKEAEEDDSVKGIILTGIPNIFSAGLDLVELYEYDRKKMRSFLEAFGSMHVELASFSKPLICAITGHSPAGGTVIAITADYRVMASGEQYRIGLNEVAVNVQISNRLIEAYSFWLGQQIIYCSKCGYEERS